MANEVTVTQQPGVRGILGKFGSVIGSVSPLVGMGLSFIQNAVDARRQRKNVDLQNQRNWELAKYQYGLQQQQYDQANKYNLPTAQMERYKQAGLNPNLIYQQGNAGNSPNVLPQYHAPEVSSAYKPRVNLPEAISTYMMLSKQSADARISNALAQDAENKASFSRGYYMWRAGLLGTGLDIKKKEMVSLFSPGESGTLYEQLKRGQLGQYNANIALAEKRRELVDKQVQNFIPMWFNMVTQGLGSISGLYRSFKPKLDIKPSSYSEYRTGSRYAGSTDRIYY